MEHGSDDGEVTTSRQEAGSGDDSGEPETSDDADQDRTGRAQPFGDDGIERLRSFEKNTIVRTGTVLDAVVVDYDDGVSPESVASTVRSRAADRLSVSEEAVDERLVGSSHDLLAQECTGTNAYVVVELPSGHVFVDRFREPDREGIETPSARRYRAFVDRFGEFETLASFSGEPVPVEYDTADGRWTLELNDDPETSGRLDYLSRSTTVRAGVYVVLCGFFVVGVLSLQGVPSQPTIGAVTPRSALAASLVLLGVATVADLCRTVAERTTLAG